MAKKLLKNGEMIAISGNWVGKDSELGKLIRKYPQPSGVLQDVEAAHKALLRIENPTESRTLVEMNASADALDARHDAFVRAIHAGLTAAQLLTHNADLRGQIDDVRRTLLPNGVSLVMSSYLDEIGNINATKTRLTADQKSVLKKIPTPEGNMMNVVQEWFDLGAEMEQLEKRRQAETNATATGPSRSDALTARNKWIRAVSALESLIELAEVPEDIAQQILGQLRAAESKTARRGARKEATTPTPPATPNA